jgi:hypothetical protein
MLGVQAGNAVFILPTVAFFRRRSKGAVVQSGAGVVGVAAQPDEVAAERIDYVRLKNKMQKDEHKPPGKQKRDQWPQP